MSESERGDRPEGVDLGKGAPAEEPPFDPYRFGRPDHPIAAEYAPPGYAGPTLPPASQDPYTQAYGQPPHAQPYGSPPPYGQQPPYGYGAPPPPPYHGYQMPPTGNGKAVAALVFGILSIVLCVLSFLDGIFVILGLVFGIIALSEAKDGRHGGRNLAVAGLICTVVGAILATVLTVLIVHAADQCGGFQNDNSSQFQDCLRHHIL